MNAEVLKSWAMLAVAFSVVAATWAAILVTAGAL